MNKKILFIYKNNNQGFFRLGELGFIYRACYFRGKELGYKDIYMEWPNNLEFTRDHHLKRNKLKLEKKLLKMKCPKETILPIKFISKKDIIPSEYDKIIDIGKSGAFYNNSEPIFIELNNRIIRSDLEIGRAHV